MKLCFVFLRWYFLFLALMLFDWRSTFLSNESEMMSLMYRDKINKQISAWINEHKIKWAEQGRRHLTSVLPSVNSTRIDQWEINLLTAAVSVDEMFGAAIKNKKKKRKGNTHVASDSDKYKQTRTHSTCSCTKTSTHTHTKQLRRKQINEVSS